MLMPFFGISEKICFQDAYIIFQKCVDNFDIAHKTCLILVWGAVHCPQLSTNK